jgi:hypothetical protein
VLKIKQPHRRDRLEFHDDLPQQSEPSPLGGVGFVSEIKDDWTCQRQRLTTTFRNKANRARLAESASSARSKTIGRASVSGCQMDRAERLILRWQMRCQ